MKKTIAALTVTALIIVGAMAALAQTEGEGEPATGAEVTFVQRTPLLQEVLDELVADGTISQGQADAVVSRLEAKRDVVRVRMQEHRQMMEEFWADGVLTADELAQLPEDHPFLAADSPVAQYLEDGELTRAELQELGPRPGFRGNHRPGGHGFGPFGGGFGGPDA